MLCVECYRLTYASEMSLDYILNEFEFFYGPTKLTVLPRFIGVLNMQIYPPLAIAERD